jgi:hypothetical protein
MEQAVITPGRPCTEKHMMEMDPLWNMFFNITTQN